MSTPQFLADAEIVFEKEFGRGKDFLNYPKDLMWSFISQHLLKAYSLGKQDCARKVREGFQNYSKYLTDDENVKLKALLDEIINTQA